MIATSRQPRATASSNSASVSAVSPEYDEATTTVCGPQNSGSSGARTVSTGSRSRGAASAATTSPAIAEPPIPQNATEVIPSGSGSGLAASPSA